MRNGEIQRVGNFSQGFGNALLDLPFPYDADEEAVTTIINGSADALREFPEYASAMLEEPTIMGVQEISGEAVTIRVTIKTKPGEQFAVGRAFRGEFEQQMAAHGMSVPWSQAVIRTMPDPSAASATRRAADHVAEPGEPRRRQGEPRIRRACRFGSVRPSRCGFDGCWRDAVRSHEEPVRYRIEQGIRLADSPDCPRGA